VTEDSQIVIDWTTEKVVLRGSPIPRRWMDSHPAPLVWKFVSGLVRDLYLTGDKPLTVGFNFGDYDHHEAIKSLKDTLAEAGVGNLLHEVERGVDYREERAACHEASHQKKTRKSKKIRQLLRKLSLRVAQGNRRAREAGLIGDLTPAQAERILKSARGRCPECHDRYFWYELTLAHILAQKLGGGFTERNLRPLCRGCNNRTKEA